jgi:hypothetical protein
MSVAVWSIVRAAALMAAIAYLFLHMEWREDRSSPFAFPSAAAADHRYIDEGAFRG